MAQSDIQKLRQQYIFNPVSDITGGGMNMFGNQGPGGMPPMMGQEEDPSLFDYGQQQQAPNPGPTMQQQPDTGIRAPQVVPVGGSTPPYQDPYQGPYEDPRDPYKVSSLDDTIDAINRVYTPQTAERDRYSGLLDQAPQRNTPGFGRSSVAAALSLKAADPVKTAESVMYAPYNRDMEDWKAKTEPFYKSAQLENTANVNERTLAGNVVTAQSAADRAAMQARVQDERTATQAKTAAEKTESQERIANAKNETAQIRARAYAYSQELGKGWEWDLKGPTAMKFNKTTGETVDTGIPTGKMDEETKIDLMNEGKIAAARESGLAAIARTQSANAGALDRAQVAAHDDVVVNGIVHKYNPFTNQYEAAPGLPEGTPTKVGTPSQTKAPGTANTSLENRRQIQDRMAAQYESDAQARQWITGTPGKYSMKPRPILGADKPGWGTGDYTQEDLNNWDQIKEENDPTYKRPTPKKSTSTGSNTVPKPSPSPTGGSMSGSPAPSGGSVRVQAPDGRTGTWDYSKGPLPPGFKVIK